MAPESFMRQTLQVSSSEALASSELSSGKNATSKTLAWCPAEDLGGSRLSTAALGALQALRTGNMFRMIS